MKTEFYKIIKFEDNAKTDEFRLTEKELKEILEGKENKVRKILLLRI